ncbi:ABC transporter ATP-binding protein [Pseudodesulfovibrio karagichevae]|uniref:ABC transporter ATP-binding protein n=1 Tax=Pseudodesulfovibrio karagichevae TaxID=3239305 RepID=A0ABV4KAL1_9BACT
MADTNPVISVRNLTCGYGDVVIVDDVTFDIRRGEVFIILGGSGCGKSTLLKNMIGLIEPMAGQVWFGDEELTAASGAARQTIIRKFGVMYQMGALFGSMSVLQNVMLPLEEFTDLPPDAIEIIAKSKLAMVDMESAAFKMPAALSGGMKKRAAIARAMALDPGILFLDEPGAGLDPVSSAALDELILDLSKNLGITFVIVTHELESIYKIADRVIMLDKEVKSIVAEGDPRVLRDTSDNPSVRRFFLRQPDIHAPGLETDGQPAAQG